MVIFETKRQKKGPYSMVLESLQKQTNIVKKNFLNGYADEVQYRYNKLELWQALQDQGCDEKTIYKALNVSRATLFRWKKYYQEDELLGLESASKKPYSFRKAEEQKRIEEFVLAARRKYPLYGKEKIRIKLEEEYGIVASVSTIGRVIKKLIRENKIQFVNEICGKRIRTQFRKFDDHAQRFRYGMKAKELGEMIQIDHMTEGIFKHFAAICPISKLVFAYAYRQATAQTGADFLKKLVLFFPFKITSIQVDGGGEFMAEFEQLCKKLNIALYVLPPRSPKLNGCVERSNGTFHYEFYALRPQFKNIHALNYELAKFIREYNEKRPHQRLNYFTPMRYLESRRVENENF